MGVPIRRNDGTLVAADHTALVTPTQLPAAQPDLWKAAGSPGYGWAWPNPDRDIPRLPGAGRTEVLTTDRNLQIGPEPGKIARIADSRYAGLVGPSKMNSFPPDSNMGYIPHQQVGKLTTGAAAFGRTISNDAWLPAVFAGNPV